MNRTDTTGSEHQTTPADRGEADTELRRTLKDEKLSALAKYKALVVGRPGLWALIKYELLNSIVRSWPGALGLFLRQKLYRRWLGRCGRGTVIGCNVTIRHPHRIYLGDNVIVDDHCVLDGKGDGEATLVVGDGAIIGRNTILSCKGGTMRIGERANISVNCTLISETQLKIGDRVLVAGHCYLIAGGNHGIERTDIPIVDQPIVQRGGIDIANDSWLGASVTVLDGVTVGPQTVVAAGAVVHRALPGYVIAGGVPAKVIRQRDGAGSATTNQTNM